MDVFSKYLNQKVDIAPLITFRIFFGLLMLFSILRFWYHGWIEKLYLNPTFHFKYYGFEWVHVPDNYTYLLFIICGISAFLVALGYQYRLAMLTFFLSFTYIELMDKTTYLNHYYFISSLSFLLIFLPAGRYFSMDAIRKKNSSRYIPRWNIDAIKLLLAIVYIYAGVAKLNYDWMYNAMPLKIWLPSKFDIPFLGDLLQQTWLHYAFSWAGMLYDVTIVFFLLYRRTRWLGFMAVVVFHLLTRVLFPIGMFPYIMISATLIFFSGEWHHQLLRFFNKIIVGSKKYLANQKALEVDVSRKGQLKRMLIFSFFIIQILLPWRYLCYPGNVFWTEEGYRFSWRVMLMEKAGYANFKIVDAKSGKRFYVDNRDFLNSFQEKQMSTQPDFILEYAHYLGNHFKRQGHQNVQVFVESYVALNGRKSRPYIDPTVDLMKERESFEHKDWILPFETKD